MRITRWGWDRVSPLMQRGLGHLAAAARRHGGAKGREVQLMPNPSGDVLRYSAMTRQSIICLVSLLLSCNGLAATAPQSTLTHRTEGFAAFALEDYATALRRLTPLAGPDDADAAWRVAVMQFRNEISNWRRRPTSTGAE